MARKKVTVVTFRIKFILPSGANALQARDYVLGALLTHKDAIDIDKPMSGIDKESITVALQEKVTTY